MQTYQHLIDSCPAEMAGALPRITELESGEFMATLRNWASEDGDHLRAEDYSTVGATADLALRRLVRFMAWTPEKERAGQWTPIPER